MPARVPTWVQALYPHRLWRVCGASAVHPTFDDGPHPEVTPRVLDILAKHGAKATFFVVGCNAEAHPALIDRIREEGHTIGDHTWAHEHGWRTDAETYLASVRRCQGITGATLFRPPYGRLRASQARVIRRTHRVVMWDVLSGDHDAARTPERCVRDVLHHARPGSIVVFHDSPKAAPRTLPALSAILRAWSEAALRTAALPPSA
jgi:peptidoglycan/xylan/chitin deacetylase (PgdA/CDA1 family)